MGILKLTLFHTKSVANQANGVWSKQFDEATKILKQFNLTLDRYPAKGSLELSHDKVIPEDSKTPQGKAARNAVRSAANSAYYSTEGRLPVILCKIVGGGGESVGALGMPSNWLPYVIIDADKNTPDGLTMLHELGHCAGCKHTWEDEYFTYPDTDNVMSYGTFDGSVFRPRTTLLDHQVAKIRKAYFHHG